MNKLEIEVAELLVEHIPSAEMVRFGKNGGDATTIAIKIARAVTGRQKVAFCGYHGWHDWFIASTDKSNGIPNFNKELISKTFKDIQDSICQSISSMTSQEFVEDLWNYDKGTGGGRTRIISNGEIEKGGVNFSSLSGTMSDKISSKMAGEGSEFYATGVSLVLHPKNPFIPSIHMNIRYIERNKKKWFG